MTTQIEQGATHQPGLDDPQPAPAGYREGDLDGFKLLLKLLCEPADALLPQSYHEHYEQNVSETRYVFINGEWRTETHVRTVKKVRLVTAGPIGGAR